MTGQDEQIANALRTMADQAASPRLRIDAAWREGRRRRRTAMTASAAGAAGAVAAAALVPLAVTGGSTHSGPGAAGAAPTASVTTEPKSFTAPSAPPSAGPGSPAILPALPPNPPVAKVELSRVSKVVNRPCPQGSHGVPSLSGHACYYLAGQPMTATVESAKVMLEPGVKSGNNQPVYTIDISIAQSDAAALNALTTGTMNATPPRDEVAWIVRGVVVVSPGTVGPLPTSFLLGTSGVTRAAKQQIVKEIEGHFPANSH